MSNVNIEKLSDLPTRESINFKINQWSRRRNTYHKVKNYWPYELVKRTCELFLSKSIDDAFSYYCKQVKWYQYHHFWKQFNDLDKNNFYDFTVDDNKNIINNKLPVKKRFYPIFSSDYKVRYKYIGKKSKLQGQTRDEIPWYCNKDDYESVATGSIKYLDYNDPKAKRHIAEKKTMLRKKRKEEYKAMREKQYQFLTKAELALKINKGSIPDFSYLV